ncbi:MAG: fatty acid desaturase [Calditrichia bacterium]
MVKQNPFTGILIALTIILLWGISLFFFLKAELTSASLWVVPAMLWQTFLYTGLFITAHDAMHGSVAPRLPALNRAIGRQAVAFYALFSYRKLLREHRLHHRHPGSNNDPDFHVPGKNGFWRWYAHFMWHYITWPQLLGMAIAFNLMRYLLHIPVENILLFWVAPALLSTLQLFFFGTYLPHRETEQPFADEHHARSLRYPILWSWLSCYHFGGYHHEHHLSPHTPWWRLPQKSTDLK